MSTDIIFEDRDVLTKSNCFFLTFSILTSFYLVKKTLHQFSLLPPHKTKRISVFLQSSFSFNNVHSYMTSKLDQCKYLNVKDNANSTFLLKIQCKFDLVTTCDLVTIFQIFQFSSFNLLHKSFDLVTVFAETKCVTKSRLHCICKCMLS